MTAAGVQGAGTVLERSWMHSVLLGTIGKCWIGEVVQRAWVQGYSHAGISPGALLAALPIGVLGTVLSRACVELL